ncbi:hypothetical protein CA54_38450 [Symmachiella macrocystis]|uniref:Uncharacterized protein n=1 Tax=Symmachiella macrocystis TaxID=2527985 RepID=A0A5C6BAZ6_9PLAN|nr:hypothetical protein CA54_38450 [Symmachiella macrocystis]
MRMDVSFSIDDRCDSIDHSTAHRASSEKTTGSSGIHNIVDNIQELGDARNHARQQNTTDLQAT